MKVITEGMHLEKEWYKEAGEQTMDTLNGFINHIICFIRSATTNLIKRQILTVGNGALAEHS